MYKSLFLVIAVTFGFFFFNITWDPEPRPTPYTPETGTPLPSAAEIAAAYSEILYVPAYPVRLSIPKIKLDAPVVPLGVNEKGELDVPDGKTKNVGWYRDGTVPGEQGSAVMDAHVYAAFSKLRYVLPGTDVYVTTETGERLHFLVEASMLYDYDKVPPYYLYLRDDAKRLNLITCAGIYNKKIGTYEKRLVVYAKLVE